MTYFHDDASRLAYCSSFSSAIEMAASIMERLAAVVPEIRSIMANAQQTKEGQKAAGDKVVVLLLLHDLAYKEVVLLYCDSPT